MTLFDPEKLARFRANVDIFRKRRQEVIEAEAAEQAEREAAELAASTIQPGPVDCAIAEAAREQATPLFGLLRRWQDALHKYESVSREVDGWTIPRCETDGDLERAVSVRSELQAEMNRFTFDGRKRLAEKVTELNAVIDDAKSRGLYSMREPLFQTRTLFSGFHPNHVRPTGRNRKQFVLALSTLAANNPQAAQRIAALFDSGGVPLFPGDFGPSIVLELKEILVGNGPFRSEFGAPDNPTIDGLEIVKDTRRASEWLAEKEAERQREENERQEAEREAERKEHELKLAEFRGLLNDPSIRDELLTAMKPAEVQPQPITETENV